MMDSAVKRPEGVCYLARAVKTDTSTQPAPPIAWAVMDLLYFLFQSIVCTMGLKWYPHPELLHCIKGCEVSTFLFLFLLFSVKYVCTRHIQWICNIKVETIPNPVPNIRHAMLVPQKGAVLSTSLSGGWICVDLSKFTSPEGQHVGFSSSILDARLKKPLKFQHDDKKFDGAS